MGIRICIYLLLLSVTGVYSPFVHAQLTVRISGIDKKLEKELLPVITLYRQQDQKRLTAARVRGLHNRAERELKTALQARGYYKSEIASYLHEDEKEVMAEFRNNLSQPVITKKITISSLSSGEGADLIGAATSLGLQNSGFLTDSLAAKFGIDTLQVETNGSTADASLVIGKYLTPKLYPSYGIGLFESLSTAKLRYDLSKTWALEAERGAEAGADILYKIEK